MSGGWRWRPLAKADATEIWKWIAADNADAAMAVLDRFEDVAEMLADYPEAGTDRSDLLEGLRSFPVSGYVLFYRRARGRTEIVRIIHVRRDVTRGMFKDA